MEVLNWHEPAEMVERLVFLLARAKSHWLVVGVEHLGPVYWGGQMHANEVDEFDTHLEPEILWWLVLLWSLLFLPAAIFTKAGSHHANIIADTYAAESSIDNNTIRFHTASCSGKSWGTLTIILLIVVQTQTGGTIHARHRGTNI